MFPLVYRTDANCVCSSDTIVNSVAACLVQTCSLADLQTAQAYFNDLCSGLSFTLMIVTWTGNYISSSLAGATSSTSSGESSQLMRERLVVLIGSEIGPVEPTTASPTTSESPTPVSHAKRCRTAPSFTSFGSALALALVGW